MVRDKIEIKKSLIPYTFNITLGNEVFEIGVKYNTFIDMFVLSLTKNSELICSGEPVVYGVPLFQDVFVYGKYPNIRIIPYDESGENTEVLWSNFNETVFLLIDNSADEIDDYEVDTSSYMFSTNNEKDNSGDTDTSGDDTDDTQDESDSNETIGYMNFIGLVDEGVIGDMTEVEE